MRKIIWSLSSLLFALSVLAHDAREDFLSKKIVELTKESNYLEAIIELHNVILDNKTTVNQRFNAYYIKAQLYKNIGIYSEALTNLELAYNDGIAILGPGKLDVWFAIETALVYCEKLEYSQALSIIDNIEIDVAMLSLKERGFYLFLKGIQYREVTQDYQNALNHFDQATAILANEYPGYLAVIYKEKLKLYSVLNQYDNVIYCYEQGLKYAEATQWRSEILELHREIAIYYRKIGWAKESLQKSKLVLELSTKLNNVNVSGALNILEKELLEEDRNIVNFKVNRLTKAFGIVSILLLILVVLYLKWYWKGLEKQQQTLTINENLKDSLNRINTSSIDKYNEGDQILSSRQISILELVKAGKTNKEIAQELFISDNTVKYHLKIIYETLGISGRADL